MPIDHAHPEYRRREKETKAIRDSVEGERAIKEGRSDYLPIPPGMAAGANHFIENGKRVANDRYSFYHSFASFPEIISPTLKGFQGIIHSGLPVIELPDRMKHLMEDATMSGETIFALWKRITEEVLETGRVGILNDVDPESNEVKMVTYCNENIRNWHAVSPARGGFADFVALREFYEERDKDDPFTFHRHQRFRELRLLPTTGRYAIRTWERQTGEGASGNFEPVAGFTIPNLQGTPFMSIPLTVINPEQPGFEYEASPILGLVRRALAIYRLSADYRRALYIKGDPQIVISGITQDQVPTKIGGDSIWALPNPNARAAYLDIDGQGIPLMREAIRDEYERFYQEGGRLIDTDDRSAESGEALRRRQVSKQVSLRDIAKNVGEQFELHLKSIAEFYGEDPNSVKFEPDLDFSEPNISGRDLLEIMTAYHQGAPISLESIHALQHRGGLTNMDFATEMDKKSKDNVIIPGSPDETESDLGAEPRVNANPSVDNGGQ